MIPILQATKHWWCPNCNLTDVTHEVRPHTRMHSCNGLYGLTSPMVPVGQKAKSIMHEPDDYVKHENVTYAEVDNKSRPVMNIVTTRDNGEDCTVFAPCATIRSEG